MFLLTRRQKRENTSADNTHPVGGKKRKDNILIKIIIKEISYIYIFVVLFKSVLSEQFHISTKIVKVVNLEPAGKPRDEWPCGIKPKLIRLHFKLKSFKFEAKLKFGSSSSSLGPDMASFHNKKLFLNGNYYHWIFRN